MSTKPKNEYLGAAVFVIILVSLSIWLVNGSSNQPSLKGWNEQWQQTKSFQQARRALAATAYNGYLYVVGGIDANNHYLATAEYAQIKEDGQLGPWQTGKPLNEGRFYNAAVASNNYLYVIGGGAGVRGKDNYPIASVERAKIHPDGSLGNWQIINHMTTPRRGLTTILYNNSIYAIGGYNGQFLKSIERAKINTDGSLSEWQIEQHESVIDRYIHSTTIHNDTIYLLGGHMRDPRQTSFGDVEHTQINPDGSLQAWQIEQSSLLIPRLVAQAFALNNTLYIAGGHTGGDRLTSIESLSLKKNNRRWQANTALPRPLSAFAITTYKNYVYALGGAGEMGPINDVYLATTNQWGKLGFWSAGKP